MKWRILPWLRISFALLARGMLPAQQEFVLCDFEAAALPKTWEYKSGSPRLIEEGALQGRRSLEITFDPEAQSSPAYLVSFRLRSDWSAYDALVFDVFNPNDEPVRGYVLVADQAWQDRGSSYWNRHNGSRFLPPGRTQWIIPVRGLYRGEAGSRNNDIRRDIDPVEHRPRRLRLRQSRPERTDRDRPSAAGQGHAATGGVGLRLRPAQPVAHARLDADLPRYRLHAERWATAGARAGVIRGTVPPATPPSAPPCCVTSAKPAATASASTYPTGRYQVTAFYENSGYWGGEQARHRERRILAGDRVVWQRRARRRRRPRPATASRTSSPSESTSGTTYMEPELAQPGDLRADRWREGPRPALRGRPGLGQQGSLRWRFVASDDRVAVRWLPEQLDEPAEEFRGRGGLPGLARACLRRTPRMAQARTRGLDRRHRGRGHAERHAPARISGDARGPGGHAPRRSRRVRAPLPSLCARCGTWVPAASSWSRSRRGRVVSRPASSVVSVRDEPRLRQHRLRTRRPHATSGAGRSPCRRT